MSVLKRLRWFNQFLYVKVLSSLRGYEKKRQANTKNLCRKITHFALHGFLVSYQFEEASSFLRRTSSKPTFRPFHSWAAYGTGQTRLLSPHNWINTCSMLDISPPLRLFAELNGLICILPFERSQNIRRWRCKSFKWVLNVQNRIC